MNPLLIAPVVLPLISGAVLMLVAPRAPQLAARLGLASTALLAGIAALLLAQSASGEVQAYLLANWRAPFGIPVVLDRLSALMLLLTAGVGFAALLYSVGGDDDRGPHFHALFQFQLLGLNGAFLTGDLFNLFVFFEVLLIASYGLLLHGGGTRRLKASLHYVSFNLAGASLFLIAVSLLYGLTGTLNMADMAQRLAELPADRSQLIQSAALLLLVVFFVKAALLPLYFWLPGTYSAASAPVAALFAMMTKVGIYSVLRVTTLIFGESGGAAADVASPWLPALALGTIGLAAVGALAAGELRSQLGYIVIGSAGTLLLAVGLASEATVAAGLVYLVNSALVTSALFLIADRVDWSRGAVGDHLRAAPWAATDGSRNQLGLLFFFCSVAVAGLPPLMGFMGKSLLLQAAGATSWNIWSVATILGSTLLVVVALSRSGSVLFWSPAPDHATAPPVRVDVMPTGERDGAAVAGTLHHSWALALLLGAVLACSVAADPITRYMQATAAQLFERDAYLDAVLGTEPVPAAFDVRAEMRAREAADAAAGHGEPEGPTR